MLQSSRPTQWIEPACHASTVKCRALCRLCGTGKGMYRHTVPQGYVYTHSSTFRSSHGADIKAAAGLAVHAHHSGSGNRTQTHTHVTGNAQLSPAHLPLLPQPAAALYGEQLALLPPPLPGLLWRRSPLSPPSARRSSCSPSRCTKWPSCRSFRDQQPAGPAADATSRLARCGWCSRQRKSGLA